MPTETHKRQVPVAEWWDNLNHPEKQAILDQLPNQYLGDADRMADSRPYDYLKFGVRWALVLFWEGKVQPHEGA
jgi:hypothetical protein